MNTNKIGISCRPALGCLKGGMVSEWSGFTMQVCSFLFFKININYCGTGKDVEKCVCVSVWALVL